MAKNLVHDPGVNLTVVLASVVSGAPVVVGQLPGVALTSSEAVTNNVTIACEGVWNLPVLGPVSPGGIVYLAAGALSTVNTGVRFGYCLDTIAGATTPTVRVKVGY